MVVVFAAMLVVEAGAEEKRFQAIAGGVEVRGDSALMQVIALRDDVLRVRMAKGGALPEDASWAVLEEPSKSRAAVKLKSSAEGISLTTKVLRVEIRRGDLALKVRDLAGNVVQQDARPVEFHGDEFRVAKTMPGDEHYFGLGDKTGSFDRREQAYTLWNTDAYLWQETTDPLYKSIPFFMTFRRGTAAGVLLDNTWRSSFDFGKGEPNVYSFGAVNGPVDYYIFYGPTPKQVLAAYAWLTGPPPLPPLWSFGYQQSRYSYTPQARVLEVAKRLRADRIPSDAIYLDIEFQQKNRPFTIDRERFPEFEKMIEELRAENFHVVAITDLHIASAPGEHYAPYDSGVKSDEFVKNPDGSLFTGKVWPGMCVFPDFTRDQTRQWWGSLYAPFDKMGIEGFWNDMDEPSVFESPNLTMPENVRHRIEGTGFQTRTAAHAEIHNVYGMENSRATYEGQLKLDPDRRPFVLTRATYAGGQRYAVTWTGDNSSTWNHLRLTTPMLKSLGLSGFAFAGADVGGYAGTPSPELLTKWIEVGAFQPIDRDHTEKGTGDQEPWVGGPEQEAIRRRFIEERYKLMPYLYSVAEESSRTGVPMLRPLFVEFPNAAADGHPMDVDRYASAEFLLGSKLLIAPSPFPDEQDDYLVEFPFAGWYDYWTGLQVRTVPGVFPSASVHPQLDQLPVYVRPGTILPMEPLVQSTAELPKGPLTLRVYPGPRCDGRLYQDDGATFAYRRGESLQMQFKCEIANDGLHLQIGAHQGTFRAWWREIHVEVFGWRTPAEGIVVNGKRQEIAIRAAAANVEFTIADDGNGAEIVIPK